jgi:hypothetical protein
MRTYMNAEKIHQNATNVAMNFDPSQFSVINKLNMMLAFDPKATALYNKVKSLPVFDAEKPSLATEVQTLDTDEFKMVGQLLNLFRV